MRTRTTDRTPLIALAVGVGAGVCGAIQPKINAVLADRVGSALLASLVNFSIAFVCVLIVLALRPTTRRTLRGLPDWPVPRWTLSAGLGGAIIVMAGTLAVETIGVAVFSVAFFAGQITFGLIVDRLGVGPGGVRAVTAARLQAAVIAIAAVVISQVGRPVGEFAPLLVVFVVSAGAAFAFQSAFNGRITAAVRDPFAATAVNVTVGLIALALIVVGSVRGGLVDAWRWPAQPWMYLGGALGLTVVLSLAFTTPVLGVFRATLAMLAAQLVTAFVVDWLVQRTAPRAGVVIGSVLIVGAVALVGRARSVPDSSVPDSGSDGAAGVR